MSSSSSTPNSQIANNYIPKVSCSIIQDLLPLYAEDLASQDAKALVANHLLTCSVCSRKLSIAKKSFNIPLEINTGELQHLRWIIHKPIILAISILFLIIFLLIALFFIIL